MVIVFACLQKVNNSDRPAVMEHSKAMYSVQERDMSFAQRSTSDVVGLSSDTMGHHVSRSGDERDSEHV